MAKIDKFLDSMISRGAPVMRLDPGDLPILELPGGHRVPISQQDLLGSVLDGVAKEILPEHLQTSYLRGDKITLEYSYNTSRFQILMAKTTLGTRFVVGRFTTTASSAQPSPEGTSPSDKRESSPAGKFQLADLISQLLAAGGSDLYLNPGEPPIIRLDGHVAPLEDSVPLGPKDLEALLKPFVPPQTQEAFRSGLDTEFSFSDPAFFCRIRMSLHHDTAGPAVAIRVIPREVPEADTLGLGEPVRRLAHLTKGLVLFTGPMGSGKSTTMACLLDIANRTRQSYIINIQNSLEFEYPKGTSLLRQKEVGRDLQRHRQAIQTALRQAPDMLAIGELRSPELIELALQAAHTGHVVFATLQTTSLEDTLYFLIESFSHDSQPRIRMRLANCLKACVGHTLLQKAGGGRVAALETFFNSPATAELIRNDRIDQIPGAMKGGRYGQVTHNDALVQLILTRRVDPMEAYLKCQDRETFITACKKANIDFDPRNAGHITES